MVCVGLCRICRRMQEVVLESIVHLMRMFVGEIGVYQG